MFEEKKSTEEPLVLNHEMFILDANLKHVLDQSKMNEITKNLIKDLLAKLGMLELGPLAIFDATDPRAPGWSFIQPITTSHVSGHYFVEPNGTNPNIHMDFYSCSSFDWKDVVEIVDKHLALAKWHGNFLYRKDIMVDRGVWEISGDGSQIFSMAKLNSM